MKTKELIEKQREYIPYGEEWKEELMKLSKVHIISLYRMVCLACKEFESEIAALEAEIAKEKDVAKTETDTGKLVDLPDFNQPLLKPISFEKDEPSREHDFKCDKCGKGFNSLDAFAWHKTYKGECNGKKSIQNEPKMSAEEVLEDMINIEKEVWLKSYHPTLYKRIIRSMEEYAKQFKQ